MQAGFLNSLVERRSSISERWEALLRIEPVYTPLANPDSLVFLLGWSLDEVIQRLREDSGENRAPTRPLSNEDCPCGRNPLFAFFQAGRQALLETLIIIQSGTPGLKAVDRDESVVQICSAIDDLARREIATFCSVCRYRVGEKCGAVHWVEPFVRSR